MNTNEDDVKISDQDSKRPLSYRIIGAAIAVHSYLGAGLLESLYEEALCAEFEARNIAFEQQKRINVDYKGRNIGNLIADLIVEDRVIVEVKSIKELAPIHTAQLITYLKVTKIRTGLLINFNVVRLKDGIKRIVF